MAPLPYERSYPNPLGHRAGRSAGRRSNSFRWSTPSCAGWPRRSWPRRSRARRSRPRPWSTRPTCGWWAPQDPGWDSRGHFFAAAAEAMRRILVDNARRKRADKRGKGRRPRRSRAGRKRRIRAAGRPARPRRGPEPIGPPGLRSGSQLVKLRYFAGLTDGTSRRTARAVSAQPPSTMGLRPSLAPVPVGRRRPRRL